MADVAVPTPFRLSFDAAPARPNASHGACQWVGAGWLRPVRPIPGAHHVHHSEPLPRFVGNAREALEFYRSVFGGELTVSTYGESQASEDPAQKDLVMHGQLTAPGGLTLMASDGPAGTEPVTESSITISLSGDDAATLRGYWDGLAEARRSPSRSWWRRGATSSAC